MGRRKKQPEPEENPGTAMIPFDKGPMLSQRRDLPEYFGSGTVKPSTTRKRMRIFLKGYEISAGNVTSACRLAKIKRTTYYRWMRGTKPMHQWFRDKVYDLQPEELMKDMIEEAATDLIKARNPTVVVHGLKTKLRDRGWSDREPLPRISEAEHQARAIANRIALRANERDTTFAFELAAFLEAVAVKTDPAVIRYLEKMG